MPKTIRRSPLVAGVLVLLLGVVVAGCGSDDSANLPDGVVARVGDANITRAQLDREIAQTAAQAKAQGQTVPAEGAEGYEQLEQQALQLLRQQQIVAFEARECGTPCKVTEKEIDARLKQIIEENFSGSQKQFDKFLKERGISTADARDLVEYELQQKELFAHVTRGVRFSEADARKYYEDNPDQFKVAAGRTASHILVPTKAEADRIRAEVTPENFAQLAREHSTDKGTAEQGGSLGPIQKGQLVPEFEKVAFALEDGEISDPVKTIFGWHIITVKITPASTTSFADAKSQVISSQLAQRRQDKWTAWSEDVIKSWDARTVYADDALKPATTTAEPAQTPETTAP